MLSILKSTCESVVGFVNGFSTLVEESHFFFVEGEFNDFLDTVFTKDTGNTDSEVLFSVFSVEEIRAGDEFLLVVENCCNALCCSCTWSVPS